MYVNFQIVLWFWANGMLIPRLHKLWTLCAMFWSMQDYLPAILIFALTACNQTHTKTDTKTLDFGLFTIETPASWKKIKQTGIDSYVGRIAIDNSDTLDFDLGWYSNTLTEPEPYIVERDLLKYGKQPPDTIGLIIVEDSRGVDLDKYRKNNVTWDSIDGRKAKIVFPRKSGIGTTGIYIDSLFVSERSVDRFNLYGENLKPDNEKKTLQVLRTLKFRKK